jgi:erythromycin esterase
LEKGKTMRKLWLWVFCVLSLVPPAQADPRPYLDLDFELPECTGGWGTQGFSQFPYENAYDRSVVQSGEQSVRFDYASPFPWAPWIPPVSMFRIFDPAEVAGKRIRLSGFIRTEGVTGAGAYASLFWTAIAPGGTVFGETPVAGAQGTTPWTRYEVEVDVPANNTRNLIGVRLYGNGTAWFDNLKVEVDGQELHQGPMPHFDRPAPGHASWLRDRVIPFDTALAGSGFADLQPLRQVLGDARIVALGEATHGTREFFQMKHRLLEFLVEEMGFTHFSIEAAMPEADRINDYVLHGVGDPEELLEGLVFWTWNTREVLDLIHWMRAYNASGKGPVQFTGFDMQHAGVAVANLRAFLAQAEPDYLPQAEGVFTRMIQVDAANRATAADVVLARGLFDHLSANRGTYLAAGLPAERVDWMIQNARVLVQLTEVFAVNPAAGEVIRDRSMAENVQWILDHAPTGSKIVLWAHNEHVKKAGTRMGKVLDERYGDEMYVLGLTFGAGRYNAAGPLGRRPYETALVAPGQLEGLLAATGLPRFLVDLRGLGDHGPARWFHEPRNMKFHGAAPLRCGTAVVTVDHYDGLIWFDQTSPSILLPFD